MKLAKVRTEFVTNKKSDTKNTSKRMHSIDLIEPCM